MSLPKTLNVVLGGVTEGKLHGVVVSAVYHQIDNKDKTRLKHWVYVVDWSTVRSATDQPLPIMNQG